MWFNYAQQQSDIQLEASLDNNQYNYTELITIKVPLSMPYQTVQSDWDRVNGEIKVDGKIYKYVKRKIVDGEMVLLCLPDHNKMRIQSAKDDFFKTTNDIAQDNSSKKSDNAKTNVSKNLVSDYEQPITSHSLAQMGVIIIHSALLRSDKLLSSPHTPPVQPPDAI